MMLDVFRDILSGRGVDPLNVIMQILAILFVIFCILPVHEWAHGFVAYKLGDPTAKNSGRLTLNPLASFDPMGGLFILLFGFGWAKPVPVNPLYFKNRKAGMAVVALAGPLSNFLCAVIGGMIYLLLAAVFHVQSALLAVFFQYYILINVALAAFNLLPIPPLDGSKILGAFLPDKWLYSFYRYQQIITMVLFVLLFTGILSVPLHYLQNALYNAAIWLASLPFRLFGVL